MKNAFWNIHDGDNTNNELPVTDKLFLSLLNNSLQASIVTDSSDQIIYANNSALQLLHAQPADLSGLAFLSLVHPEDKLLLNTITTGAAIFRVKTGDEYTRVEGNKTVLTEGSQPIFVITLIPKKFQDGLAGQEHMAIIDKLLEAAAEAIVVIKSNGKVLYMNTLAEALFGYSKAELVGHSSEILIPEKFRPLYFKGFQNYLSKPEYRFSGQNSPQYILNKNGNEIPVEISLSPVRTDEDFLIYVSLRDVSQIKESELKLLEREAFFRAITEHSADILVATDADNSIIFCSPSVTKILGFETSDYLGKDELSQLHADDLTILQATLKNAADQPGLPCPLVIRKKNRDGKYLWLEGTVANLLHNPSVNSIIYNLRDVTDRLAAELRVRKTETILSAFFASSTEGFILVDRQLRVMTFNSRAEQCFIYKPNKNLTVGENILEALADVEQPAYKEMLEEAVKGKSYMFDRVSGSGQERYHLVLNPVRTDRQDVIGACFIISDVTEQRRAEEALGKSEANLRTILDNADTAYVLLNNKFDILSFNQLANTYALLDLGKELKEGENFINTLWKKWQPAVYENMQNVLHGIPVEYESSYRLSNGSRLWFHVRVNRIMDERGEVIGLCISASNVTERKQAEDQIREFNAHLENKVKERTYELEVANKELESFSYSVSHDLRAPLRSLNGYSQALLEDYAEVLDEKAQHYLKRIQLNSERMATLIDDLLKLSRVTRQAITKQEVNLSKVAREIIKELEEKYKLDYVNIHIEPSMIANADLHLIRIALHNLLDNAIKFSAKADQPEITFTSYFDENQRRVFCVSDNGVGFDMQYAGKLFGAFQRLHDRTDYPGTGIGLSIVQRVINRHGGRVWAESTVGNGAKFYFTL